MSSNPVIIRSSVVVGMRHYAKVKYNPIKDLSLSHKDAIKLKRYMMDEMDWEPSTLLVDNAALELNIHTAIRKQLDDIEARCKISNDGIYYLNFISFIGHGVIND
jgi:hypothetical protein